MSGLEKFQASEAWRTTIKKFLFMERSPALLQQTTTISETQRYSLDIGEDLKNILEQNKNTKSVKFNLVDTKTNNQNTITAKSSEKEQEFEASSTKVDEKEKMNSRPVFNCEDTSIEHLEAIESMCDKTASDPNSTLFKYLNGTDEQKDGRNVIVWQKTSDESFEALEKMCDKTASDPNSTLFHYLHSEDKDQVLADVKKRSADGNILAQGHVNDPLLLKLNNCTLLDDIEEPSRMWENTICTETIVQTSPVKMVGLLRPSTILEEAPDDSTNSNVSSQMSFQTATKGAPTDVSSSTYDTAHDSTIASTRTDISNKRENNQLEVIDVDHILLSAFAKTNAKDDLPSKEIIETTTSTTDSYENKSSDVNMSVNLIDLEKTFSPLHNSSHSLILEDTLADVELIKDDENEKEPTKLEETFEENEHNSYNILDESIIEILSDEDEIEENEKQHEEYQDLMLFSEIKTETYSKRSININHDTYSFSESSSYEENKENCDVVKESSDKSMQFNDTMEEVEYMMRKGMEYLAAEAAAKEIPQTLNTNFELPKTQPNSPMIKKDPNLLATSTSKVKSSNYITPAKKTPSTKCDGSSSKKRYGNDIIKPFPKFDLFAKPGHARHKELTSKQQKFSHIISPIGTYVKKTGTTPLMSSLRNKNKNSDILNSTAFRELENESRLYQPKFETNSNTTATSGPSKLAGLSGVQKALPKKAYISSELKHIVDERTPVTIPGGKKIQKYIENAMMPAVLRHDGKFKIPEGINKKLNNCSASSTALSKLPLNTSNTNSAVSDVGTASHIPRRNNASLADLSLMSGDVSMYTIMDAQKF